MESSEDPSHLITMLLEYLGIVKDPEKKNRLFGLLEFYTVSEMCLTIAAMWVWSFEDHSFLDKALSIEAMMSTIHLSSKLLNLKFRSELFWSIIKDGSSTWREMAEDKRNHEILMIERARIKKILRRIMTLFLVATPITILMTSLHNLTSAPEERQMTYKMWDPIRDTLGEDWFITRCVYQCTLVFYTMALFGAVSCSLMFPCLMANTQMRVLCRMLTSDDINVKACLSLHQFNLKFVRDINRMFSLQLLIELLFSAIIISIRAYNIIQMLKTADPRVIGELIFLGSVFADPFIICYSGQVIKDMSEEVFLSSYQNRWYELSSREKKTLCMLIGRSARILQLDYRGLMTFDMIRFGAVFQGAYSYITLML